MHGETYICYIMREHNNYWWQVINQNLCLSALYNVTTPGSEISRYCETQACHYSGLTTYLLATARVHKLIANDTKLMETTS